MKGNLCGVRVQLVVAAFSLYMYVSVCAVFFKLSVTVYENLK